MFNLKLKCQWKKIKINMEYGTNNNSATSSVKKDSLITKMIWFSLELGTLLGIWKYILLPLFSLI